jgi:hypothetical protein
MATAGVRAVTGEKEGIPIIPALTEAIGRTAIPAVTGGRSKGVLPRTADMPENIKGINIIRTNMETIQAELLRFKPSETAM